MSGLRLVNTRNSRQRDLRTLLPGLGTGVVIVAAVVLAFATIGAFVAFDGTTQRSDRAGQSEIVISDAPAAAVPALNRAEAPAADRGPASPIASASAADAPGAGALPADAPALVGDGARPDEPTGGPDPGPNPPDAPAPPSSAPPPNAPAPSQPVPSGGIVGDIGSIVGEVDDTIKGATGIDPGLGRATAPITKPVDDVVAGATAGQGLGLDDVQLPHVPQLLP